MSFLDEGTFDLAAPAILPLRSGPDYAKRCCTAEGELCSVEDLTEALLADDRRAARREGRDVDYLTTDQLVLRWERELLGPYGIPDVSKRGMYRRAFNPDLGQRPVGLNGEG